MPSYTYTADSEDYIYIAGPGTSPSVFFNGKYEPIYRYAVWNDTKTKILEYSDDLPFLREKYGHDKQVKVLTYKPFMEEQTSQETDTDQSTGSDS